MKKRVISIMLMLLMVLSYGGLAAYAEVEGDQLADEPAVTEAPAEEAAPEADPAPVAEGEEAQPAENETTPAEEASEEDIVVEEEIDGQEAEEAGISNIQVVENKKAGYDVTWDAFEAEEGVNVVYKVYADGELQAEGLAETTYSLAGLALGMHTVKVEAWAEDGDIALASGSTSFTWKELVAEVAAVRAMATYKSVTIKWTPVEDATGYELLRCYSLNGTYTHFKDLKPSDITVLDRYGTTFCYYRDTTANAKNKNYFYKVIAVKGNLKAKDSPASGAGKMKDISYFVTLKKARTLTSHDGYNKTHTFPAGTRVEACGFGGGKYKFYYTIGGKSYYFYVTAISTKNASAKYNKKANYTAEEAEWYVNQKGVTSRTGYMIYANLYTQHVYVFKGSKGKWRCVKDFECSSGSAKRPSPSGDWKEIHKRIKNRHARPYWSCYSDINAFHCVKNAGKKNEQGVGYPDSNGCIRCKKANAYYIYYTVPMWSKVVVY